MHRTLALLTPLFIALGCASPTALKVKSAATAPGVEQMPQIEGTDHGGTEFSLESALAKGPVVVIFYRGHW